MSVNNTLYPPIVETFMPAFVYIQPAHIYFSISPYNNAADVRAVHVSLQKQSSNENALTSSSGVLIQTLDNTDESGLYCVTIRPEQVENGKGFNINEFYKVQIRLDSNPNRKPEDTNSDQRISEYLLNTSNQTFFSEWSSICLIRPIYIPELVMTGLNEATDLSAQKSTFNKGIIPIAGHLTFSKDDKYDKKLAEIETETLSSYHINVFDPDKPEEPVLSVAEQYTGNQINPNEINYKLDMQGVNTSTTSNFNIEITIMTSNQYTNTYTYPIVIADYIDSENLKWKITGLDPKTPEEDVNNEYIWEQKTGTDEWICKNPKNPKDKVLSDDGIVHVRLTSDELANGGTLYIKRSSSLSNFRDWEEIRVEKVADKIDIEFEDNTITSLVWYRYSAQLENALGGLSQVSYSPIVIPDFYDAILSRGDKQLRIQYGYQISNMKPVVNRQKTDTLGGKYPKFTENAILNYKQFSISGTLSAMTDENQLFLNRSKFFNEHGYITENNTETGYTDYLSFNEELDGHIAYTLNGADVDQMTYDRTDYWWEREFRELATEWLNDGEPKLYRSMTEGSMVVMLTDVSLTPKQGLSRRIWDFTATMYEVEDGNSLTTLDSLGIYEVVRPKTNLVTRNLSDEIFSEKTVPGQLYKFAISTNNDDGEGQNLRNIMLNRLQIMSAGNDNWVPDEVSFNNVKIWYESKPHNYMVNSDGSLSLIDDTTDKDKLKDALTRIGYTIQLATTTSGYKNIFINQRGFYAVPEELDVQDIIFDNIGDVVTIEFIMTYVSRQNLDNVISNVTVSRSIVGQEYRMFDYGSYFGDSIKQKYNFYQPVIEHDGTKEPAYVEQMRHFSKIKIEGDPHAVFSMKYVDTGITKTYYVPSTGIFETPVGDVIENIAFYGRRMFPAAENVDDMAIRQELDAWEYIEEKGNYENIYHVANPINNHIYTIAGKTQIYYKNNWYKCEQEDEDSKIYIAQVPIEAMVNYLGNVMRETL